MIQVLLLFWILSALLIVREQKIVRIIIYLNIFSLISALCFFVLGSPDVAMAEAAISVFATIFFIVCFEKYYGLEAQASRDSSTAEGKSVNVKKLIPLGFTIFLFALYICFIPAGAASTYLKDQYVAMYSHHVGGENAVTAIYLAYRIYDTLLEALMLLVSVVAVAHLSWYSDTWAARGKRCDIGSSTIAAVTIRVICPVILMFGAYLIMNGHIAPGGGFQGGVAIAIFFICRYMIYDIYDIHVGKIIKVEKLVYVAVVLLPVLFIFFGMYAHFPQSKNMYLVMINMLIGMKVACGFLAIFYRYIVFERR